MLVNSPALVLSTVKYGESDLIARLYVRELGMQSYMLKGVRKTRRGKLRPAMFQPLTQLVIQSRHKNSDQLEYIKEAQVSPAYEQLHNDVVKSSIALFFSEVLTQLLTEQQSDHGLYDYLAAAFEYLDRSPQVANFSIKLLLGISFHMGFSPDMDTANHPYFNLQDGTFDDYGLQPKHTTEAEAGLIKKFIGTEFDAVEKIKMNRSERSELLATVIEYFQIHLHVFKKPSSLLFLKQIFD